MLQANRQQSSKMENEIKTKQTNKQRKQANIKTIYQACKLGNRHQKKQTNKQAK